MILRNPLSSSSWATNSPHLHLRWESPRLQCNAWCVARMCRARAPGWAIFSYMLWFHSDYPFLSAFLLIVFKRDFGGRCWARRWYTNLRAMIYPGFSLFLSFFLSFFFAICKRIKSCYWIYVVSKFCRVLIHRRHRLPFYHVPFSVFFFFEDWFDPGRRTRNLKDTPSHLYRVPYVYSFSFPFFFSSPPFFLWHIASWASWTNSHIPG